MRKKQERRLREAALLAEPGAIDRLCEHVKSGVTMHGGYTIDGGLCHFAAEHDITYHGVSDWLKSSPARWAKYEQAVLIARRDAPIRKKTRGEKRLERRVQEESERLQHVVSILKSGTKH